MCKDAQKEPIMYIGLITGRSKLILSLLLWRLRVSDVGDVLMRLYCCSVELIAVLRVTEINKYLANSLHFAMERMNDDDIASY